MGLLRLYKITTKGTAMKATETRYTAVDASDDIKLPFDIKRNDCVVIEFLGMVEVPLYGRG